MAYQLPTSQNPFGTDVQTYVNPQVAALPKSAFFSGARDQMQNAMSNAIRNTKNLGYVPPVKPQTTLQKQLVNPLAKSAALQAKRVK